MNDVFGLQLAPYKAHEWEGREEARKIIRASQDHRTTSCFEIRDKHIKGICPGETSLYTRPCALLASFRS